MVGELNCTPTDQRLPGFGSASPSPSAGSDRRPWRQSRDSPRWLGPPGTSLGGLPATRAPPPRSALASRRRDVGGAGGRGGAAPWCRPGTWTSPPTTPGRPTTRSPAARSAWSSCAGLASCTGRYLRAGRGPGLAARGAEVSPAPAHTPELGREGNRRRDAAGTRCARSEAGPVVGGRDAVRTLSGGPGGRPPGRSAQTQQWGGRGARLGEGSPLECPCSNNELLVSLQMYAKDRDLL